MFGNGEISTTASQKCLNHPIMLKIHITLHMQIFKCLFPHQWNCCVVKQLSATSSSPHPQPSTATIRNTTIFLFFLTKGLKKILMLPVIGASGRDCSFLHAGTNTVISLCPFSRNQSTASWIPRQENPSLFPWLKNMQVLKTARTEVTFGFVFCCGGSVVFLF